MEDKNSIPEYERRDRKIVDALFEANPKLSVNPLGVPSIMLPLRRNADHQADYPIQSKRAKAELSSYINAKTNLVPHQSEVNRAAAILEGIAWQSDTSAARFTKCLDREPLLEAVHIFILQPSLGGEFIGTCTKLLQELQEIARANGISTNNQEWPKSPAALSYRLRRARPLFESGKIGVERQPRTAGKRRIKLWLMESNDADAELASQERHNLKPSSKNSLGRTDADDGAISEVFKRIDASSGGINYVSCESARRS